MAFNFERKVKGSEGDCIGMGWLDRLDVLTIFGFVDRYMKDEPAAVTAESTNAARSRRSAALWTFL